MLLYLIALHYVLIIHFTPSQRDVLELRQRWEDQIYSSVLLHEEWIDKVIDNT